MVVSLCGVGQEQLDSNLSWLGGHSFFQVNLGPRNKSILFKSVC